MVNSISNAEYIAPFQSASDFGNIPKLTCWFDADDLSTLTYTNTWSELPAAKWAFDGSGDFINTPASAIYNPANKIFSAEAWVYITNNINSRQTLISTYGSATTGWSIQLSGEKFCAGLTGDGAELVGTTNVQLSTWYHVAVAGGPTTYYLYVNNAAEASFTGNITFAGATALQLGRYTATTALLFGYLSNVRVVSGVDVSINPGTQYSVDNFASLNTPETVFLLNECYLQDTSKTAAILTLNGNVLGIPPNPISEWRDKSGNNVIATQTTTNLNPGLSLNRTPTGKNGVSFNGIGNFMSLNSNQTTLNMLSGNWSSFVVYHRPKTLIENNSLSNTGNTTNVSVIHASDNYLYSSQNTGRRTASTILSTGLGVAYVDTNQIAYFNGTEYPMATDWAVTPTNVINCIGRRSTTYNRSDIYEILHIGFELPTYEVNLINSYLNIKWGIY